MKIYLDTIGCRLNQSEIEQFAAQFRAAGHTMVDNAAEADYVIVNTCAVTSEAASDSRGKIRQAARVTGGKIIATGCWATLDVQGAQALDGVTQVVPNAEKDDLVASLLQLSAQEFDLEPVVRQPLPGAHLRTRAFLKVQDGCDNFCTFCITRIARGKGRSRPLDEVLKDVELALQGGAQEIVLTGVHMASWGRDFEHPAVLYDLVQRLLQESALPRLRLSSLEPWDLDERFFSLWQDARLCRHLHLPLQSGSADTLRRMARKTTPADFCHLVAMARAVSPQIAVTTDMIAGFPGESDAAFEESLSFVRSQHFAGGHVFSYSARPGTAAARMPDQIHGNVRKMRSAILRQAFEESARQYRQQFIGATLPVLWETTDAYGPQGWRLHGLSDNYLHVFAFSPDKLWNHISQVCLLGEVDDGMSGKII